MRRVLDRVGAAPWLMWDIVGEPATMITWETDRTAAAVASDQVPGLRARCEDEPEKVAAVIDQQWTRKGWIWGVSPDAVLSGRLPCATTPALDENGRAAPRGCSRGKQQRWLADRRQSATLPHPLNTSPEPAWEEGLQLRRAWRHDLARIRREVLDEVHLLNDFVNSLRQSWFADFGKTCCQKLVCYSVGFIGKSWLPK
eukprot:s1443_g15.t1